MTTVYHDLAFDEPLTAIEAALNAAQCGTPATPKLAASVIERIERIKRQLDDVRAGCEPVLASHVTAEGGQVNLDGLVCKTSRTARVTNLDRDALETAVLRHAASPEHRADPATGEIVEEVGRAQVALLRQSFRLEPRWGQLRSLRLFRDDFAEVEWVERVSVKRHYQSAAAQLFDRPTPKPEPERAAEPFFAKPSPDHDFYEEPF